MQDDIQLMEGLRRRDEGAYTELVERFGPEMRRVATRHVSSPAVAEEVVQETWISVMRGVDEFEGRASLRTWILRILVNRARKYDARERRSLPFTVAGVDGEGAGRWSSCGGEPDSPEQHALARHGLAVIVKAIARLPASQRRVLVLRDLHGWEASEVCAELGIEEPHQRVLLHRARVGLRRTLVPV